MRLLRASHLAENQFNRFVKNNEHIEKQSLRDKGYIFELDGDICGCFQLERVAEDAYWLKQLYITKNNAKKLPLLLEVILLFAKQLRAKRIYAHSQQPVTDFLLDAFSFSLQQEVQIDVDQQYKKGHWWLYHVS